MHMRCDGSAALMPDSSMIITQYNMVGVNKTTRYVFKDNQWIEESNKLVDIINATLTDGHIHFRFSHDFTRLFVLVHEDSGQHFYELSKNEEGIWGLPQEVLIDNNRKTNSVPSYSFDNSKLFTTIEGRNDWSVIEVWGGKNYSEIIEKIKVPKLKEIIQVISIGEKSLLLFAAKKKQKEYVWYLIKETADNSWTAPVQISSLKMYFFGLATTAFPEWMIYSNFENSTLYLHPTPPLLKAELKTPKRNNEIAISQNEKAQNINQMVKPGGKYHAVLIGNSDYQMDKLDLVNPTDDVDELKQILTNKYSFNTENIITLKNATRDEVLEVLYRLRKEISVTDNLLIFYAGHGYWDDKVEQGYWWPVDTDPANPSNWLSNSDLKEQIRAIRSAHTLLISDACFSGGIFRARGNEIRSASRDIQLLYRLPSRRAMSSGNMSSVSDNSVFFKYLIKYLDENTDQFLSSSDLFTKVRRAVLSNSLTVPQDGVIMGTGDEGGDFIFIQQKE
ncbi:caspase family protein [Ekhidna lutea]|nr:caspase family protein [Ekhidna lutea]